MEIMSSEDQRQENLRIEYQAILDAIKNTKTQQWLISTYVIALQAGIIKILIDLNNKDSLIYKNNYAIVNDYAFLSKYLSGVISMVGAALIIGYIFKIKEYRNLKNEIAKKLNLEHLASREVPICCSCCYRPVKYTLVRKSFYDLFLGNKKFFKGIKDIFVEIFIYFVFICSYFIATYIVLIINN